MGRRVRLRDVGKREGSASSELLPSLGVDSSWQVVRIGDVPFAFFLLKLHCRKQRGMPTAQRRRWCYYLDARPHEPSNRKPEIPPDTETFCF